MVQSAGTGVSRGLSGSVTLDLKNLDDISVTPSSGASFSGAYEMGALVGTYANGGSSADVDVSNSGTVVDDWFFQYD